VVPQVQIGEEEDCLDFYLLLLTGKKAGHSFSFDFTVAAISATRENHFLP
jgi:hypothetical protein